MSPFMLIAYVLVFVSLIFHSNTSQWTKRATLADSYFHAPVKNILRCGKLCELQTGCAAATFGVVDSECYLHREHVSDNSNNRGRYVFQNFNKVSQTPDPIKKCSKTEMPVPSAGSEGITCLDLEINEGSNGPTQTDTVPTTDSVTTSAVVEKNPCKNNQTFNGTNCICALPFTGQYCENVQGVTEGGTDTTSTGAIIPTESVITAGAKGENPCKNNQTFDGTRCICSPPFTGQYCENMLRDCSNNIGFIEVYPEDGNGKIQVCCYAYALVIFAAPAGGFAPKYLNATWNMYKNGFGSLIYENNACVPKDGYWLGNDNIHRITNGTISYLLEYFFNKEYAFYYTFSVESEADNYTVNYTSYNTRNKVEQSLPNGRPFSAHDRNDEGCAVEKNTGFWFDNACLAVPPILGGFRINGRDLQYSYFWASLIKQ